ncbi:MAG: SIS domain-containing protein [Bacteroidales bacterium]|nr:SIS domain-containing protein [Bacteroidales bacterium]
MTKKCVNLHEIALEVVKKEAEAVRRLSEVIDENFNRVVELIHGIKGRVIVAGMGKSGIVASKMVSTFNSTGTRAQYLHAADALHGDLGMVTADDVVIIVSKSGNTSEIEKLALGVRKIGAPIVAIVSNKESFLAKSAEYILYAPIEHEACCCNLAPTVSTTVHLVLGDALAVALENLNGFGVADFAKVHPEGSIGEETKKILSL